MLRGLGVVLLSLGVACGDTTPDKTTGCPDGMSRVTGAAGPFCMSSYEVRLLGREGALDQGPDHPDGSTRGPLVSAAGAKPSVLSWYQASAACQVVGHHLCTSEEWEDACDGQPGPGGRDYGTPDGALGPGVCGAPTSQDRARPQLRTAGGWAECHTPDGVYDLTGNLWEWTDPGLLDVDGLPVTDKRGGGFYTGHALKCHQGTVGGISHPPAFRGSIGFRCCTPR